MGEEEREERERERERKEREKKFPAVSMEIPGFGEINNRGRRREEGIVCINPSSANRTHFSFTSLISIVQSVAKKSAC